MCFDLTDNLSASILEAMENQNSVFIVDALSGSLVEQDQNTADNERFYVLPQWTSADGFALREQFVSELHAPLAKDELQQILHSGRGVFRNFKNCIKQYPEIERKWHAFKHYKMQVRINDWYNALREIWGLEKLDQEPEDFEDLVLNDFVFRGYDSIKDKEPLLRNADAAAGDMNENWPEEVHRSFTFLWKHQFESQDSATGFTCRTFSDEFAGCITFSPIPSSAKRTVVLTGFFVIPRFRSLGIGKELFSRCIADLKKRNIQWVLIANVIIPDSMIPLLDRFGFEKIGSGYIAKLF